MVTGTIGKCTCKNVNTLTLKSVFTPPYTKDESHISSVSVIYLMLGNMYSSNAFESVVVGIIRSRWFNL
jgi:hypothetical protein